MCGIAGIVTVARANATAVRTMTEMMAYRGPDGEGLWISGDEHCALGHRRLAIIDCSPGGRQPMVDAGRSLAITYNGEIYNYIELRARLEGLGYAFRGVSDTEVLLTSYAAWGEACLSQLNGMFAFAIWDERRRTLFCARDRFGEKPFYYASVSGGFAFASEAKALAAIEGVDLGIDEGVLASYVHDGSTQIDGATRTLIRGIRQLLPAQSLEVQLQESGVVVEKAKFYWTVDVRGRSPYGSRELASASDELLALLDDSVRLRMRSDVAVGSCLSGGLDSSSIVALMRSFAPTGDIRTFTGIFPGDPMDEGRYASLVADHCHTRSFETEPTADRFLCDAERLYWHADFPIGGLSQFAQWCVFQLASRNDVTVLLDGQGSDELLGGYGNTIVQAFLRQLWARGDRRAWFIERNGAAKGNPTVFSWPRLALTRGPMQPLRSAMRRASGRSRGRRSDLFNRDWYRSALSNAPPIEGTSGLETRDALSATLWTLAFRTMLSSLLRFGDRLSMAHSREVRLPFCDYRIAELAFALPPELLVGDGQVKRVLRAAIRNIVPQAISTRAKQGFIPPQEAWLTGPLSKWVQGLADDPGGVGDVMDVSFVRTLSSAPIATRRREVANLWDFANLAAWSCYSLTPMHRTRKFPLSIGV